jgi:hypothetical protein
MKQCASSASSAAMCKMRQVHAGEAEVSRCNVPNLQRVNFFRRLADFA